MVTSVIVISTSIMDSFFYLFCNLRRSFRSSTVGFTYAVTPEDCLLGSNEGQILFGLTTSNSVIVSQGTLMVASRYVSVGDVVQSCYEPPDVAMVYHDDHDGKFALPEGFDLVYKFPALC